MTIPDFQDGYLLFGIHETSLEEIRRKFGSNMIRQRLINGLECALQNLQGAGVRRVYINGSFVTRKAHPKDIDGCWDADEQVREDRLDPVFLDFKDSRRAMREKYGVDFFVSQTIEANSGVPFVQFFQQDRDGRPKGILLINLEGSHG